MREVLGKITAGLHLLWYQHGWATMQLYQIMHEVFQYLPNLLLNPFNALDLN